MPQPQPVGAAFSFESPAYTNSEASQLLTAEQLAERWQIKPSTVYAMTRRKAIPTVRLGARLYRYRLGDIVAFERAGGGGTDV